MYKVYVYAHRGASKYEFENTLKAFDRAVQLGADGIEIDVQLTKDGVPVVIHDLNLFRLTGKRKLVNALKYDQLRKKKVGKPFKRLLYGEKIMTLKEVVAWAIKHQVALNVELKESFLAEPLFVKEIIRKCQGVQDLHFSSFHYELLEVIKSSHPKIQTAFIISKQTDWSELMRYRAADAFHLHKRFYKEDFLQQLRNTGKKVRFYGLVGNESFIANPHPIVRGWITDYPDLVLEQQKRNSNY